MTADGVFVTGATGFIGRHLVLGLLERGFRVFALTRGDNGRQAGDRLIRVLQSAYGRSLPEQMLTRLQPLDGDLVKPDLGLQEDVQKGLAAEVSQIFHCGGDTRFFPKDRAAYRAVHLDGPLHILRAIDRGQGVRFHHVSTAYVAGRRNGTAFEDELAVGQSFRNPYERVKLEAEQTIRSACKSRGIGLTIFRPSIVIADPRVPNTNWSDPISTRFAGFARLCGLYKRALGRIRMLRPSLRVRGSGESALNVVPITYVIEAMLAIAANGRISPGTFHLVDPTPPRNHELLDRITEVLGLHGLEPFEHRTLPIEGASLLERVVENLLRPYQDYFFESPIFDDRHARRLLNGVVERRSSTAIEFLARAADTSRTSKPRSPLPPPVQTAKRNVSRASDVFP
jgi:thioester reductase-like protein